MRNSLLKQRLNTMSKTSSTGNTEHIPSQKFDTPPVCITMSCFIFFLFSRKINAPLFFRFLYNSIWKMYTIFISTVSAQLFVSTTIKKSVLLMFIKLFFL